MRRAAIVGALLILSSLPAWRPQLELTRDALALARRPYAEHRAHFNGSFWRSIAEVRRRMARQDPLPVLLRRGHDFDRALFLSYYVYPQITRFFFSLDHYRAAAPAPPETPIAYIDVERLDAVRVMTYPEIRAEQAAEEPFAPPTLSTMVTREAILPFAVSFDGRPPDSYVTQAAFLSDRDGTLTLTLEPDGRAWLVPLHAGKILASRDLIWDAYRVQLSGWIRISSTVPLRAGAALVNRGRHRSTPIPIFTGVPPLPRRVAGGEKLWLLNESMQAAEVQVNGATVALKAYELRSLPSAPTNTIEGTAAVLPFTSHKLPDGNTRFVWP
jgi:hypothetical protein